MSGAWFFLAGLFLGLGSLGGEWRLAFVPAAAGLVLAFTSKPRNRPGPPTRKTTVVPQARIEEPGTEERRQERPQGHEEPWAVPVEPGADRNGRQPREQ